MKLRLHDNAVRLRLTPGEVAAVAAGRAVEASVPLVPSPLAYRLEVDEKATRPRVAFVAGVVRVTLPRAAARRWASGGDVGITAECGGVRLLVEKDFHCLHGEEADAADRFPNPLAEGSN